MEETRIVQLALVLGVLYTIWLTYRIIKRRSAEKNEKMGCMSIGYLYLIVLSISALAIGFSVMFSISVVNKIDTIRLGQKYEAIVVSFTSYEKQNSDDNGYTTMYTPTVHFTANSGDVVEYELDYSTSGLPIVGEKYTVYYDEVNERVTTFSFGGIVLIFVAFIAIAILVFVFLGMVFYAMNWSMTRYKEIGVFVGLGIVVPLIMFLFDGALIWALFNGEEKPTWVYFVLILFILGLSGGLLGYLKMIYSKGITRKRSSKVNNIQFTNTSK